MHKYCYDESIPYEIMIVYITQNINLFKCRQSLVTCTIEFCSPYKDL